MKVLISSSLELKSEPWDRPLLKRKIQWQKDPLKLNYCTCNLIFAWNENECKSHIVKIHIHILFINAMNKNVVCLQCGFAYITYVGPKFRMYDFMKKNHYNTMFSLI